MDEKDVIDEALEFVEPRNIMQTAFDFFWMHKTEVDGEPQEPKKKSGPSEYLDFVST